MTDEKYKRLEGIVADLNHEAGITIVLSKQYGNVGAHLEPYKEKWVNLDGYNLLGQMRLLVELTKDVQ